MSIGIIQSQILHLDPYFNASTQTKLYQIVAFLVTYVHIVKLKKLGGFVKLQDALDT